MDAHVFRYLLQELRPRLIGKRMDRIYQPWSGVWTIRLASRQHLLLASHAKHGLLLLSPSKPDNPEQPSSETLWWRKRIGRRKIADVASNWPGRQAAFLLEPGSEWLLLDIVHGLDLRQELPAGFEEEPEWPDLDTALSHSGIFRTYPQMTPLLRSALAARDRQRAKELLHFLRFEKPESFFHCTSASGGQLLSAWPPGDQLGEDWQCRECSSAEEAAYYYGWTVLQAYYSGKRELEREKSRALKKTRKKLDRVREDEERLRQMASLYDRGLLLQTHLYCYDPHRKYEAVEVLDEQGRSQRIELDPALTYLQNMEALFRKARKGSRGLQQVARRRQELEREMEKLRNHGPGPAPSGLAAADARFPREKRDAPKLPPRLKGLQVSIYLSEDNFTIVRGKNKRSNHKLLSQAAKPFDMWFHAQDGPGAHVILQRDFAGQEVPRRSILDAALVAGLYSYQSLSNRAHVICALVRDVRPVKGADLGQVRIDNTLESMVVELDSSREQGLRLN
ncbi:MAG: NFACT RNA binding domain-containing protein [Desulfohalobiaceae bacterium]|nr:NFACT RNA binding domain-containing protein [Desulfohalobiaceae bacterium]